MAAPGSGKANGFDVVAIQVDQEGGVVVGTVIGAHAGLAVVLGPNFQAQRMEAVDGLAVRRAERDVGAGAWRRWRSVQVEGSLPLGPKLADSLSFEPGTKPRPFSVIS